MMYFYTHYNAKATTLEIMQRSHDIVVGNPDEQFVVVSYTVVYGSRAVDPDCVDAANHINVRRVIAVASSRLDIINLCAEIPVQYKYTQSNKTHNKSKKRKLQLAPDDAADQQQQRLNNVDDCDVDDDVETDTDRSDVELDIDDQIVDIELAQQQLDNDPDVIDESYLDAALEELGGQGGALIAPEDEAIIEDDDDANAAQSSIGADASPSFEADIVLGSWLTGARHGLECLVSWQAARTETVGACNEVSLVSALTVLARLALMTVQIVLKLISATQHQSSLRV